MGKGWYKWVEMLKMMLNNIIKVINEYRIRIFLLFSIFILSNLISNKCFSQCILSSTDDTVAEVIACHTSCGCSEIIVPNGVTITLADKWDLTSLGPIVFTIEVGGKLILSGNGANNNDLTLASSSILIIEDTNPDNDAITNSGGLGQVRITIGDTQYQGKDFDTIIESGGADENGPLILPIELISFTATPQGKGVLLS